MAKKQAVKQGLKKTAAKGSAKGKTYAEAGVDIGKADEFVETLKKINPAIGGFSGLFPVPPKMKQPQLVASTDGVGTKLLVAQAMGSHRTIGIDLVAMVVNDLIVCGAKPLFFLDYFAVGKLTGGVAGQVIEGIVEGCRQAGCALIGGETAEMPGMYGPGHYDLAGFAVGAVEKAEVVDGRGIKAGDVIVGLGSSGLHSNGYSLARAALMGGAVEGAAARRALAKKLWRGGPSAGEAMMTPTKIYVKTVLDLMRRFAVTGAAHITGGGLEGNLVRVLPKGVNAWIDPEAWERPRIFETIAEQGPVEEGEMFKVFNMGVGFVLVVRPEDARRLVERARALGETAEVIGWIDAPKGRKGKAGAVGFASLKV